MKANKRELIYPELSYIIPSRYSSQIDEKQLYFYLRNSQYELGYLINFSTPKLLIKRIVYSNHRKPFIRVNSFSVSR